MSATHPGIESEDRLAAWIGAVLPELEPPLRASSVGGGRSNLTYRIDDARGRRLALRRPPLGELLASAHDVAREHRVLTALTGTGVRVPAVRALCEDGEVLGAPFLVTDWVDGLVLRDEHDALALSAPERRKLGGEVVDALAAIHAVDLERTGLAGLARHDGHVARIVRRWSGQWRSSGDADDRFGFESLGARLAACAPEQRETTLIHGDFRLDNLIAGADGTVLAVVDWELCTLGDPLTDLGLLMVYWPEAGDPHFPLGESATAAPGFPGRAELAARYGAETGRDVSALPYYKALGAWKLAIVLQGVIARARENGYASSGDAEALPRAVANLAADARAALDAFGG